MVDALKPGETMACLRELLKMSVKTSFSSSAQSFSTLPGMLSGPASFRVLMVESAFFTLAADRHRGCASKRAKKLFSTVQYTSVIQKYMNIWMLISEILSTVSKKMHFQIFTLLNKAQFVRRRSCDPEDFLFKEELLTRSALWHHFFHVPSSSAVLPSIATFPGLADFPILTITWPYCLVGSCNPSSLDRSVLTFRDYYTKPRATVLPRLCITTLGSQPHATLLLVYQTVILTQLSTSEIDTL